MIIRTISLKRKKVPFDEQSIPISSNKSIIIDSCYVMIMHWTVKVRIEDIKFVFSLFSMSHTHRIFLFYARDLSHTASYIGNPLPHSGLFENGKVENLWQISYWSNAFFNWRSFFICVYDLYFKRFKILIIWNHFYVLSKETQ